MYMELEHELAKYGFADGPRLEALFRSVDFDKSGTLDFKEFLSLVYLWHNVEDGDYSRLFETEVTPLPAHAPAARVAPHPPRRPPLLLPRPAATHPFFFWAAINSRRF